MLLNCGVGEDSWESLGLQGDLKKKNVLNVYWKDWCWSWSPNTLATLCKELTPWKRPWCWERLKAVGGGDRGWDVWMASSTQWAWVWVNSRSCDGQGGLVCCSPWGHKELDKTKWLNWTEWSSGFPYFPQFKSEFGNKEFIIWATVSSWSCLCWLYRTSPSLAAKNIINLILVLSIWWCPCVESSLVLLEEGVWYDQSVFLAKLH